jgi:hypothetical protein
VAAAPPLLFDPSAAELWRQAAMRFVRNEAEGISMVLYFVVGDALTLWSNQELRAPERLHTYFQGPGEYTAEGQRRRRIMLRYRAGHEDLLALDAKMTLKQYRAGRLRSPFT